MKNTDKFVMLTLSLLLLSGYSEENGASGNISETEYQTALTTTSDKSVVLKSALSKTTAAETEETVTSLPTKEKSEEQQCLEQLITEAAKIENPALKGNETSGVPSRSAMVRAILIMRV